MNKRSLLLLTCWLCVGGCTGTNGPSNSESSSVIENDIFDSQGITLEQLQSEDCVFFENLVFAKGNKNHVFVLNDSSIVGHHTYPLVELDPENYSRVVGMDLVEAIKIIGCPTYIGIESELSLDYSDYDGYLRRVFLEKKGTSFEITKIETNYKYAGPDLWVDKSKTKHPSIASIKKLRPGMTVDEVVKIAGKFTSTREPNGTTTYTSSLKLDDGRTATLSTFSSQTIDGEYMRHDEDNVNTYKYLYLARIIVDGEEINTPVKEPTTAFSSNDNKFMDDSILTVEYLKRNNCFFFENMAFASDSKNHVFFLDGDQIIEHKTYDKIAYKKCETDLFDSVAGKKLVDTFSIIGIPTFIGLADNNLSYSLPYGVVFNIATIKKDNELYVSSTFTMALEKDNPTTYKYISNTPVNFETNTLGKLEKGMSIDEVMRVLGKANKHSFINNTAYSLATFDASSGKPINITFKLEPIKEETEYAKINKEIYFIDGQYSYTNIYNFYVETIEGWE